MARLIDRTPRGHWYLGDRKCGTFDDDGNLIPASQCGGDTFSEEHLQLENGSLKALEDENRVWSTPIADGAAYYYIQSERPLTVTHIPYGDCYHAAPATVRGLRMSHVQQHRDFKDTLEMLAGAWKWGT